MFSAQFSQQNYQRKKKEQPDAEKSAKHPHPADTLETRHTH
jgi:hypothetical protein